MKRFITLSIFILTGTLLFAQPERIRTERYTGTMRNGLMKPGEVTYYYYKKEHEKVMHGVFRYRLRWRSEKRQRVYQTISGTMEHGLKTENWNYSITAQDYFKDDQGYYYTYDVQLNAAYKDGIPHGEWQLNKSKKRRKEDKGSRKGWTDYTNQNMYSVYLEFDMGKIVDSVYFKDKAKNILITGKLDSNSMFHGDWIIQEGETRLEETYFHGIVTHRIRKNTQSGKVENEESLMENKNMWIKYTSDNNDKADLTFRPDTLKVLKKTDHPIPQMINKHIFDYRFFLYSYIPGDKLIKDYPGKNPADLFEGLYKVRFKTQINKKQALKLSSISRKAGKVRSNYRNAKKVAQQNQTSEELKSELNRLERITSLSAKYDCLAGNIKLYMDMNEGTNAAYDNCNMKHQVRIKLPTGLSKNELIRHIHKKVNNYYEESNTLYRKVEEF